MSQARFGDEASVTFSLYALYIYILYVYMYMYVYVYIYIYIYIYIYVHMYTFLVTSVLAPPLGQKNNMQYCKTTLLISTEYVISTQ